MNVKLSLIDFDGPLDLLLTLIKENKMEIENIDISKIATQYLNFIYAQQNIQINEMGEYLLITSTLL
jgi:segregation and condensation protein A